MRIMEPVLPREMETAIPLEEALAMAAAYEEPVYGYAFAGGSAAGHQLEKDGIQGVHIYELPLHRGGAFGRVVPERGV